MLAQSASFAEAAGILPTAGSVYDYVAAGMGRFFAITASLAAYLLVHVFAASSPPSTSRSSKGSRRPVRGGSVSPWW
jgi:amino acid transporter